MLSSALIHIDRCPAGRQLSDLELLARGCHGPLIMFGTWGSSKEVYVACQCPPKCTKFRFAFWDTQEEFLEDVAPFQTISLLRVVNLQADPTRNDYFAIGFLDGG